MKFHIRALLLLIYMVLAHTAQAQKNSVYQSYIDKYTPMAVEQMRKHHIPASITMAQALLESGAGRSYLAVNANNHFGIKVSYGWNGGYVRRDDDRKNEKFRKYRSVEDSYEDHSLFLKKDRYKSLFNLDAMDYRAWARGLKACGYATLPTYADRLIGIIETYDLQYLDEDRYGKRRKGHKAEIVAAAVVKHDVVLVNGKRCVVVRKGDTWDSLAKELKVSRRRLLKYNEASADVTLVAGTNVFLQKKAKKAEAKYKKYWHKIKPGESLYSISQLYGVRIENIYKMNYKDASYVPVVGDLLKVR